MSGVQPLTAIVATPARMAAACLPAPMSVLTGTRNAPAMRATVLAATTTPTNVWNGVRQKAVPTVTFAKMGVV
jgi:hypothetical protein